MGRLRRWSRDALRIGYHAVREPLGLAVRAAKKRLGLLRPVAVLPYRGFGNRERLYVLGRVLEDRATGTPTPHDPWWRNAAAMVQRFRTVEVPDVGVRARLDGAAVEGRTDEEGYFDLELEAPRDLPADTLWHRVEVALTESVRRGQPPPAATATVMVPSAGSTFGIVSDIDDTVMHSHATDLWKLISITVLHNARTRVPLAGAAAFYRALAGGRDGARQNPFFYVSSAAWNLYDVLRDFLEVNAFPAGPLLLRDFGLRGSNLFRSSHRHKIEKVERILATTGSLPFVLIGDAGQDDPDLYHQIARQLPGRVAAVYIRAVSWRDRSAHVLGLADDLAAHGVPMLLVEDTRIAAEHAAGRGFIPAEALAAIAQDRREDRAQARE